MHLRTTAVVHEKSNASLIIAAILFGVFVIAMETVFKDAVRLPGHRAFPGALGLLIFAQAFAPMMLVIFAGSVSTFLVMAGYLNPWFIGVWMITAAVIWVASRTRLADTLGYFLLCGLIFGLMSFLVKMSGFHHTPQTFRAAGYIAFGALGGLTSFGVIRGLKHVQQ